MVYLYEAMDATGRDIKNTIEATSYEDAMAKVRQMGYFVTKIDDITYYKEGDILTTTEKGKTFIKGWFGGLLIGFGIGFLIGVLL